MLKRLLHKTLIDAVSEASPEVGACIEDFDSMLRRAKFEQKHHYSSTLLLHYPQLAKLNPQLFSTAVALVKQANKGYLDLQLSADTIAQALHWLCSEVSTCPSVSSPAPLPKLKRQRIEAVSRRISVLENAAKEERFDIVEVKSLSPLPDSESLSNSNVALYAASQYFLQDNATVVNYSHVVTAACDALDVYPDPVRFFTRTHELARHIESLLDRTSVVAATNGGTSIQLNILSTANNVLKLA